MAEGEPKVPQKAVSLPKLGREAREEAEGGGGGKRISKDIHKARWSMAPKCLL